MTIDQKHQSLGANLLHQVVGKSLQKSARIIGNLEMLPQLVNEVQLFVTARQLLLHHRQFVFLLMIVLNLTELLNKNLK